MKLHGAFVVVVGLTACGNAARREAVSLTNQGNTEKGAKQYDSAIDDYQKAVDKDRELHPAWWGMGMSYLEGKHDPDKAADALQHCAELLPDSPSYQLYYGVALFEKAVKTARDDQARRVNKKPEDLGDDVDLRGVSFETASQHLKKAIELNADMWRAHYFLGKIYRAQEKAKDAADEFTKAIATGPRERQSYVALSELYRKWDDTDEAIKVATQGTLYVPQPDTPEIWYTLGMGYDDKRQEKEAIDAFTHALDLQKDMHKARFQRGQAYFRTGDMTNAKRDLEEFSKSGGASLDFIKQQASKMLMDIAAKAAGATKDKDQKPSPEEAVKKGGKGGKGGFKPPKH